MLDGSDSCRLCFATNNGNHMDVFSVVGIEMKMSEIISEHFKCEISADDLLPNFVCHSCWQTTEAFHELYERVKNVQKNRLDSMIKSEVHENMGHDLDEESQLTIGYMKSEEEFEYEDAPDAQDSINDADDLNDRDIVNGDNEIDPVSNSSATAKDTNRPSKKPIARNKPKKRRNCRLELKKLFAKHKNRFDMTCDDCSASFESYDDACAHYLREHNKAGYIKCCTKKLWSMSKIVHHLNLHIDSDAFKCKECGKVCKDPYYLKEHIKLHHSGYVEKKQFICDICKKILVSKTSILKHMKMHVKSIRANADDQYSKFMIENFDMSCDHCDAVTFVSLLDARTHYEQFHNDAGYLKCCQMKFSTEFTVKDHIRLHFEPDCFKCDVCSKTFSTRTKLIMHKRQKERPYMCDYCGSMWRSKLSLTDHMFRKHVHNSEPKFECEICQRKFLTSRLLKQHKYHLHENKIVGTCEICGAVFTKLFKLKTHKLKHADESERRKEWKKCEYCGDWLKSKSAIAYHKELHTTGPKQCPLCPKVFATPTAVSGHIRRMHRELKYNCDYCDKKFAAPSARKKHMEYHTRHNSYQCQFCPRVFALRTSLISHQVWNHREERKNMLEEQKLMKRSATPID